MLEKNCKLCGSEFMYEVKDEVVYKSCPNLSCINRSSIKLNRIKAKIISIEYSEDSIKTIIASALKSAKITNAIVSFDCEVKYNNVKFITSKVKTITDGLISLTVFEKYSDEQLNLTLNELIKKLNPTDLLEGWHFDYSEVIDNTIHCIYNSNGGELSKTIIYELKSTSLAAKMLEFYDQSNYTNWSISQSASELIIQVGSANSTTFFIFIINLSNDNVVMQKIMPNVTSKVLDDSAVNPKDSKLAEIVLMKVLELKGELNDSIK